MVKLGSVADVRISGVDKKTIDGESPVRLCNYTDVYYNWTIRPDMSNPFMVASARQEEIEKFRLHAGQVAITKDSETRDDIGHAAYVASDFDDVILGYHCALITPHIGKLDGQYLNALFRTRYMSDYLARNAGGSGQRYYLSESAIREIPITLPSYESQLRIAGILGSLDEKIELNRKKIVELEALAKTIYDYWFVQFDFPDENGKPYKSSGGKMVWNEHLKREVPEGWEIVKLPNMATILFGYPFDGAMFNSSGQGKRIVRIRNIKDGRSGDFTTEDAPENYIIHNGDLLVGMDGYFDVNVWVGGDAYLVQRSCRIQANEKEYQGYLRKFIIPPIKQLEKNLLGATVAHLGKAHLDAINVVVPPKQSSALEMLNVIDSAIVRCGLEISELTSERDTLLPLLMNGQVKVAE